MKLIDYSDPTALASRFRARRRKWLVKLVGEIVAASGRKDLEICDVGGTWSYWAGFPFDAFPSVRFRIDLLNLSYPDYDREIAAAKNAEIIRRVGDACNLEEVGNQEYALAHSNSVIEHVGGIAKVRSMSAEVKRIARFHYVQTPNFWFPLEPHTLLPMYFYLPKPWRCSLLRIVRKLDRFTAIERDESLNLLDRGTFRALFPEGDLLIERALGVPKSFTVAYGPRHERNLG